MTDPNEAKNYEENFQRLSDVVGRLEREQLGLEESLTLFEEGMRLVQDCDLQLNRAEERIKVLVTDSQALSTRGELPLEPVLINENSENTDD